MARRCWHLVRGKAVLTLARSLLLTARLLKFPRLETCLRSDASLRVALAGPRHAQAATDTAQLSLMQDMQG